MICVFSVSPSILHARNDTAAHPDLVAEDLGRRPVHERVVVVHAVDHEGTTTTDVVDGVVANTLNTGGLNLSGGELDVHSAEGRDVSF